jgi:hypothetical protein
MTAPANLTQVNEIRVLNSLNAQFVVKSGLAQTLKVKLQFEFFSKHIFRGELLWM